MARKLSSATAPFCALANNPSAMGNHLLAALTAEEMRRLRPHLEPATLARRATLHEPGARVLHGYFPISCVISMVHVAADGSSTEVGVIGNEGCTGAAAVSTGGGVPLRAVVRAPGFAYRVKVAPLQAEFRRGARFQRVILRYMRAVIGQSAQIAACNRRHSVDQQLCRWLLAGVDRARDNELATTQESIAAMLGVRREGITEAASSLQKAGLIRYSRGRIEVLSRAKLEARACECYKLLRGEVDRLVRDVYSPKL